MHSSLFICSQQPIHLFPIPARLLLRLVLLVPVLADTVSASKAASLTTMVTTAEISLDVSAAHTSMLSSRRRLYGGMCLEVVIFCVCVPYSSPVLCAINYCNFVFRAEAAETGRVTDLSVGHRLHEAPRPTQPPTRPSRLRLSVRRSWWYWEVKVEVAVGCCFHQPMQLAWDACCCADRLDLMCLRVFWR